MTTQLIQGNHTLQKSRMIWKDIICNLLEARIFLLRMDTISFGLTATVKISVGSDNEIFFILSQIWLDKIPNQTFKIKHFHVKIQHRESSSDKL